VKRYKPNIYRAKTKKIHGCRAISILLDDTAQEEKKQ
jgi:hypothetical protein